MSEIKHPVIYLTGAPATGKSSAVTALTSRCPALCRFDWGSHARAYVSTRLKREVTYDEIRAQSASLITPEVVTAIDRIQIEWTAKTRVTSPVLIDTHAVTRESFGFRTTPFLDDDWKRLQVTHIVLLYASPEVVAKRLKEDAAGRLMSDGFHITLHAALQGSVATAYAILRGIPLHAICTDSLDPAGVATMVADIAGLSE